MLAHACLDKGKRKATDVIFGFIKLDSLPADFLKATGAKAPATQCLFSLAEANQTLILAKKSIVTEY